MFTSLQTRLTKAGKLLPLALLPFAAHAQFNYAPTNAVNVAGTYADLGTTGTVIATTSNDDANSAAQPIGFTFTYNGTAFTQFVLNTNGLIRLGAAAPSVANIFLSQDLSPTQTAVDPVTSTNAADVNLIMPFNMDLVSGTSAAEYRVITTGTAPNRVCTIQWKNVSDKTGAGTDTAPTQYSNFSFQAKLYETTNNIEFVYGATTPSTGTATSRFPSVGVKGTAATNSVLANKPTGAAAWSTAVFIAGPYTTTTHNIRNAAPADLGRTYRFVAATVCADPTAATIGNATNNSAQISFTPGAGNVSYNVTYSSGGTPVTVTPAPTSSPITITGLAPGTTYTVTLQSVCSTTSVGALLTGTVTTTGTPTAAPYVTLPYTESFEGPWVNGLATRDIPTVNWRNSPATGDNSWRREDDGTIANWRYLPSGAYTPSFSTGAHSARFHTYGTPSTAAPGRLDLYANLSGTGTKTLSFDYINPTGTDRLDVLVSTDGGATFTTTPILSATINTTFTNKTVVIPSTSATSVIRFQATSDFGDDDLGIDNLRLSVVTATQNAALAANVNLYPNPAHQSFQLKVPAGLNTASAQLINALGQVVQTRQLSLPAAGGTVTFNVSSLAAGVYSLQLKSGADLVVQRVVVE